MNRIIGNSSTSVRAEENVREQQRELSRQRQRERRRIMRDEQRKQQRQARRVRDRERRNAMTDEQRERERERRRQYYHQRVRNQRNEEIRMQRERMDMAWRGDNISGSLNTRDTNILRMGTHPNENSTHPTRRRHQAQTSAAQRYLDDCSGTSRSRTQFCDNVTEQGFSNVEDAGLPVEEIPDEIVEINTNKEVVYSSDDSDMLPFQDEDADHEIEHQFTNETYVVNMQSCIEHAYEDQHIRSEDRTLPNQYGNSVLNHNGDGERRRRQYRRRPRHNCARNYVDSNNVHANRLPEPRFCPHCQAKLFHLEPAGFCCSNGTVQLSTPQAPTELMQLYTAQTEEVIHFRHNIRAYNHAFCFTSMGVHVDEQLASSRQGLYTYRAQGSIYHRIGSLLPMENSRPRYLQLYIYDTEHEIQNRIAENENLDRRVMSIIQRVLDRDNPYVHQFRQVSERIDIEDIRLVIKDHPTDAHQYNAPSSSQAAAILIGGEDLDDLNERDIIVQKLSGQLENVPNTAGYYDPLQYPLLLPYGSLGWDLHMFHDDASRMSCREFYSYMLQIRPHDSMLLLRGGRLLQQYVVDNYVKISTQRLRYVRDHQKEIRAEWYQGLLDTLRSGENQAGNVGRKTILPPSYVGSPRDMHRRYHDAMAIVKKYGKLDIFITMTCNASWEEITSELLPGQTPSDRPDLTSRVFRAKYEELKEDLYDNGILGHVVAYVHVIEFQKRGLPHAHILLILDEDDKLRSPEDYDQIVRAEIPDPTRQLLNPIYMKLLSNT